MKIKTWLLLSYFFVMVLPLIAVYALYVLVNSFYSEKKVEEYTQSYEQIQNVATYLEEVDLYKPNTSKEMLDDLTSEKLSIVLYNKDGLVLYSSNPKILPVHDAQGKEQLFQQLYELEEGLRSFTYKQPVFEQGSMVGVYEIQLAREQLIENITKRGWIVTVLFIGTFVLIYGVVAIIIHRRLNKRLYSLMEEMSAFAKGHPHVETETGKDEIGELKQHFYAMKKQIQAAQEVIHLEQQAKEYMVATISHDLKTPLTSIKAYAESLDTEKELSEKEKEAYRKVIINKADFMRQMLDDLITHTLLQSQEYEMEFVTVDGEEFFDMIISDYEALCKEKEIQLQASNFAIGQYDVNPKQMLRVADNLMMNAIQHTGEGDTIWITAISEKVTVDWVYDFVVEADPFDFSLYAYLIVQNEGEGISEENIDYLFNPLYQVDQSRSKKDAHGTGLGLSITKRIIEKHGGKVHVFSKVNVGACFICSIPKRR